MLCRARGVVVGAAGAGRVVGRGRAGLRHGLAKQFLDHRAQFRQRAGLCADEPLVERRRVLGLTQLANELAVADGSGDGCQGGDVLSVGVGWDQQQEKEIHRLTVDCLEVDGPR